jgi:Ca-activated chloride channel family protein
MAEIINIIHTIEWVWIQALWLIPLPLLLIFIPNKKNTETLFFPHAEKIQTIKSSPFSNNPLHLNKNIFLWWIIWALLCISLARPIIIGEIITLPREGRNIMLAVDISGSMRERDMVLESRRVDRLTMVKAVVDEFIKQRKGDKLGLILFGTQAFVQSPLSYDLETVRTLLSESAIGLAGQNTAIGDAIGLTVKHMEKFKGEKLLILLTDGQNTAGVTHPLTASQFAQNINMKIYTIGIGRSSIYNRSIDIKMLNTIASKSGGQSFLVQNTAQLKHIYQKINKILPTQDENDIFRTTDQYYWIPLLSALILLTLSLIIRFIWKKQ